MPLTASDVANKQFTTVKLREGYNMEEVDSFLDEVEGELGRLHREIDDLTARLAAAPAQVAAPAPVAEPVPVPVVAAVAPASSDSAVKMLELAQKTADEYVATAKMEGDRIVAEARAAHARTMGDLEGERTSMQAKVDELRAFEKEYRTRLRSYLEGQLRDLDAKVPAPSGAPAPAQPAPQQAQPQQAQPQQQSAPRPFSPAPAPEAPSGPPVQAD